LSGHGIEQTLEWLGLVRVRSDRLYAFRSRFIVLVGDTNPLPGGDGIMTPFPKEL
jgi:hypothetical protein